MQYLRLNESQSQRIYGWFSTASNPVGSEYIVMEKLEGVTVTDVWFNLSTKERRRVIEQVMLSLQFRASGSIYFPLDLSEPERSHSVPLGIKGHEFCIGPMAHYSWWHGERGSLSYDYGPCKFIVLDILLL